MGQEILFFEWVTIRCPLNWVVVVGSVMVVGGPKYVAVFRDSMYWREIGDGEEDFVFGRVGLRMWVATSHLPHRLAKV